MELTDGKLNNWNRHFPRRCIPARQPHYCIRSQRCRLCQFVLNDGDRVVARITKPKFDNEFIWRKEFSFHAREEFTADHVRYHLCYSDRDPCSWKDGPPQTALCFHPTCYRLLQGPLEQGFLDATDFDLGIDATEDLQYKKQMQNLLISVLQKNLSPRLPYELWTIISADLIQEFAFISAEQQLKAYLPATPAVSELSLERDIYASYLTFNNIRYVRGLRNATKEDALATEELVFDAGADCRVEKLYAAVDSLGVRRVYFGREGDGPPGRSCEPGALWRITPVPEGALRFRVKSDGTKVRDLIGSETPFLRVTWPVPDPPEMTDLLPNMHRSREADGDWRTHDPLLRSKWDLRMGTFECNLPGITGYSMATVDGCVTALHTHRSGEPVGPYGYTAPYLIFDTDDWCRIGYEINWIYFPVNPGDLIDAIYVEIPLDRLSRDLYVKLVTNRGDIITNGDYHDQDEEFISPYTLLLHRPSRNGCRVYFNRFTEGVPTWPSVRFVAFEDLGEPEEPASADLTGRPSSLALRQPAPELPYFLRFEYNWGRGVEMVSRNYTHCNLENVVEIIKCRRTHWDSEFISNITGILVEWADGTRKCLGQVRFDHKLERLSTNGALEIHICIARVLQRWVVLDMQLEMPADPEKHASEFLDILNGDEENDGDSERMWTSEWISVPFSGLLEWWFAVKGQGEMIIRHRSGSSDVVVASTDGPPNSPVVHTDGATFWASRHG